MRRPPPFLSLITVLLASPAIAELNFQQVVLDNSYFAYERDVGDIDGDGDNDIVCVEEGDTTVQVFAAPSWTRSTLIDITGTYRWPRADDFKVADINGDGDLDVVTRLGAGPSDDGAGIAVWYENLGGGTNWSQHLIGSSLEYVKDIVVADFDRDLRPDVAMRMDSQTQLWLQETNGTWTEVLLAHAAHEGMDAGDVDMDGDPDIVLNGFWFPTPDTPAACRVAANYTNRTIDSAWYTQSGDWTANSCKIVVGDIDGDGSNDVVFSQSERAGYSVTWYRSATPLVDGTWAAHPVAIIDYCHNLQAADWDLDGDTDLLVGGMIQSQHKGLRLLLNEGRGTNWSTHSIQEDGSYSAEMGDIDEDGDPDIVGILNWNSAPTYIYRNNTEGPPSLDFWQYIEVSAAHVRSFGLTASDVDGDGDLDIASGPYVYRNPGGGMTSTWTRTTVSGVGHVFAAVDVDGDALTDLLALQDNAGANRIDLFWVEATDTNAAGWSVPIAIGEVPRSDHAEGFQGSKLAQIVTGGPPEIVISSLQGVYYFEIPTNPAAGNWPRVFVAANDSDEGIGVEDIDGDNNIDVAFTGGGAKSVKWARNPGDGSSNWIVHTIGSFPEADWPDRCEVADLNGDARPDIVVTEENSGASPDALACWWEQPEAGATNANWMRHTIATQYTMNNLDAADFDGDGDMDLSLAEHRGTKKLQVWENDGDGVFTSHLVDSGYESHLGARAFDLDGDGDLDLVSIAYDDYTKLHVWRNDSPRGVPTVARPTIHPSGGVFDELLEVTLTCATPAAEIRYTTDGSDPTNASVLYSSSVSIATSTVVKARGFKTDYAPSQAATAIFTGPQVQTPSIVPPGGTFSGAVTVSVVCATTGATIRYTTDGTDPTEASSVVVSPLVLAATTTVKVRGFRSGLAPSIVAAETYAQFQAGAVAHWRFDERFGAVAMDASGGGHTGLVSGAQWVPGYRDYALHFDGVDDVVQAGTWDVGGTAMTVCAWIRLDADFTDNDARIISKAVGSQEQDHYWMLSTTTVGPDRRLRVRLKAGGSTTTLIAGSTNLDVAVWTHVAASYDGSTLRLFVNGSEIDSVGKSGTLDSNASAGIGIGANPPDQYAPLKGVIDDVRVYNTALDAGGIQAVMNENPVAAAPTVRASSGSGNPRFLDVDSEQGHYLLLQRATNLLEPAWTTMSTNPATTTNSSLGITDDAPHAVYRILMD